MEIYLKDSGLLCEIGVTQDDIDKKRTGYNPQYHEISDTGQQFPDKWSEKGEIWFYISAKNRYYQNKKQQHAIEAAAEESFGVERWEEIQDELEGHGFTAALSDFDIKKMKHKTKRLEEKGIITNQELKTIDSLMPSQ